jgi:beta-N-acetylhexosaminidase
MNRKAIIVGIKKEKLTVDEKIFLKKEKPWGVILFSRNIKNLDQLKLLVKSIKDIFKDKNYPIIIDQEGGKVSRLNKILDFSLFSQGFFGNVYKNNNKFFQRSYKIYTDSLFNILKDVGININTVPVLDVRKNGPLNFIRDRSFSHDPYIVTKIGKLCIDLHQKNKIGTVTKHIPGHGETSIDSHFSTPIVNTSKKKLFKKDFKIFKDCKSIFTMTAHVIYKSYDSKNVCTHSKIIINNLIRKKIKFKGIIISDDISMKALKFNLIKNAVKALEAGCNLILHCNGNIKEMRVLSKVIPKIDKFTQKKTTQFYKFLG